LLFDTLGSLTIGNGGFAYTVDFTGLQTFPDLYKNGIPLGTQSDWGWHSFPNENNYHIEETLMCAGYDGCSIDNPGIPRNGLWKVKWEDLSPMP
jgi:hypothetical protein